MADEVVIIGADGQEHVFPPGFDPKRAAAIVREKSAPVPQAAAKPQPSQRLAGVGIQTVSDEDWAKMTPGQKAQGLIKAAGYGVSSMMGWGKEGREAVDHPALTLATAAIPSVIKGAKAAIPSTARAGVNFQEVMGAAKNVPIDISAPGNAALRIMQLSERGGTMPKVVRDILKRMTDPNKPPMAYEEARDFASNVSRLSADEYSRLTPALKREVGNLRVTLNHAVEKAAASAGKGPQYKAAMKEYAKASQGRQMVDDVKTAAKRWAIPGGVAYFGLNKLSDLLRGD